jgi:hypothetical protein
MYRYLRGSDRRTKEKTRVLYGTNAVMNTVLQFLCQARGQIDACVDYTRPSLAIDIVTLKRAFIDAKKRGIKIIYATEINKNNISYCKQMMSIVDELRHLDGIKGNFYISDGEYIAPANFHEAGMPASTSFLAKWEWAYYSYLENRWSVGLSVKVLVPGDKEQIDRIMRDAQPDLSHLDIRSLDKTLRTQIGILVVDRKESVIVELKVYQYSSTRVAYSSTANIGPISSTSFRENK